MNKKNILFVHQAAELYGSDKVLLALVAWFVRQGHFWPIVVLPSDGPLVRELNGVGAEVHIRRLAKIQRQAFTPVGLCRLLLQAIQSVREIDQAVNGRKIVAVHSNTIAALSGALWSRARGVRHLWHIHEIIRRPRPVAWLLARLVAALSDQVICISRAVRDHLIIDAPRVAAKSLVVANGIALPARPPEVDRPTWRAAHGLGNRIVVGLVGRINSWKGHTVLLEALRNVLDNHGDIGLHLLIVGGPPPGQEALLQALNERIASLALDERVTVLPFVEDIWPVWCAMDIAVVPSTEPEPFGMVALEAMCAARPLIVSGHGGLADIVVDGVTGLITEPGNPAALAAALVDLGADEGRRERMGRAGRERVEQAFGLDRQANAIAALYHPAPHPAAPHHAVS